MTDLFEQLNQMGTERRYFLLQDMLYHLMQAGMWSKTHQALLNFDYLQSKCNISELETSKLIQEFSTAIGSIPAQTYPIQFKELAALYRYILTEYKTWSGRMGNLFSQLYPHLVRSEVKNLRHIAFGHAASLNERNVRWLRRIDPPDTQVNLVAQHREYIETTAGQPLIHFSRLGNKVAFAANRIAVLDPKTGLVDHLADLKGNVKVFRPFGENRFLYGGNHNYSPSIIDIKTKAIKKSPLDKWLADTIAVSDGKAVIATSGGKLHLWDTESDLCKQLINSVEEISCCHPYLEGGFIWGTKAGKVQVSYPPFNRSQQIFDTKRSITTLRADPEGKVVAGDAGGKVVCYAPATSQSVQVHFPGREILNVEFIDTNRLAVAVRGGVDRMFNIAGGTVEIWDTSSGAQSTVITHAEDITAMHITSRGHVISGGQDGKVFLFKVDKNLTLPVGLHERRVINVIATDDDLVVSADADGLVKIWDINANREPVMTRRTAVTALAVSRDSKAISGHVDGTVMEWDLKEGAVAVIIKHHSEVTKIVTLDNGDIATTGKDRTVRVWRAREGLQAVLREHKRWVIDLWPKTADEIVSKDEIQTMILWNYKTGEFIKTGGRSEDDFPQSTLLPRPDLSLHYNERLLLEAMPDGRVALRDKETILAEYDFQSGISCVAASETRQWIVVGLLNGRTGWLTLEPADASGQELLLSAWSEKVG